MSTGAIARSPIEARRGPARGPQLALGLQIADLGVSGGAVYDALVGAAARQHQRPLVSDDARARPVYEALGVELEMIRT